MTDVTTIWLPSSAPEGTLRASGQNLVDSGQIFLENPQPMAVFGADAICLQINRKMADLGERRVEDHIGKRLNDIMPDQSSSAFETVLQTGQAVLGCQIAGARHVAPEDRRDFLADWFPVRNGNEIVAVGVNLRDVTKQTQVQAQQVQKMRELQHRLKNMPSNVLALVSRARREWDADTVVLDALAARIRALTDTHKLLTIQRCHAVDIRSLIEPELTDIFGSDSVHLSGPDLMLNARAAVALGMAVHELATNAAKYGAFSQGHGKVSLTWTRVAVDEAEHMVFRWIESGGPKIEGVTTAGFGSQLLASTISGSLGGRLERDWRREGLTVEIAIPLAELRAQNEDLGVAGF